MNARTRTSLMLAGAAAGMLGLAFASKPLYDAFCRATGYGGTTQRADAASGVTLDRTVTVRFDANVSPDLGVRFEPAQHAETVHLGENGLAFYRMTNVSPEPVTVIATFNVTPFKAGSYFRKVECFCFQEQHLAAGESVEMPVVYYVDPEMAGQRRLEDVQTITLSYTAYRSLEEAAQDASEDAASNGPAGEGGA
jgi:cytochrome c oxidase assembly protein subunit 11